MKDARSLALVHVVTMGGEPIVESHRCQWQWSVGLGAYRCVREWRDGTRCLATVADPSVIHQESWVFPPEDVTHVRLPGVATPHDPRCPLWCCS